MVKKAGSKKIIVNLVYAVGLKDKELKELEDQVRKALKKPSYSIITNYELIWNRIEVSEENTRVVYAEGGTDKETEILSKLVNRALKDPDHVLVYDSIVHWQEIPKK